MPPPSTPAEPTPAEPAAATPTDTAPTGTAPTEAAPAEAAPAEAASAATTPAAADRDPLAVLLQVLDLETIDDDLFRGRTPADWTLPRVFGGQVAGQALVAAVRTVPRERRVHSLHAYFLRPGDPTRPIVYEVDRIRDGRSFTTRRVVAVQRGQAIFNLQASFQVEEAGVEHEEQMPDVPGPEELPTLAEALAHVELDGPAVGWAKRPRPVDLRYVGAHPLVARGAGDGARRARSAVWLRADGRLPDDPLLHVCVATYASDMTLLDSVLLAHGLAWGTGDVAGASLDHAMWFHRPFRADEWLLYDQASPAAGGGRGLATGRIFTRDGHLAVSVVQEGLVRTRR